MMVSQKRLNFLPRICLAFFLFVGCTTSQSVYDQEPSYVVQYQNADRIKIASCADEKFIKKHESAYFSVVKGGNPYAIEYWWRLRQPAPMFISKFYDDRVEINGRFNIWRDYGEDYVPFLESCINQLGGDVADKSSSSNH